MTNIIIYILFAYGLSNMLVFGMGPYDILDKFRNMSKRLFGKLGNMFDCMMCTSANIGWTVSLINILFFQVPVTPMMTLYDGMLPWYAIIFGDLCITSGSVWLIGTMQEALERNGQ